MSVPIPQWWCRATYKDEQVYAGLEGCDPGAGFARVDGLVPYRYRGTEGERVYRTRPDRLTLVSTAAIQLPDAVWADDQGPRRASGARRSTSTETDTRVAELIHELATAQRRIRELENDLRRERRSRTVAVPSFPADLDELIQLCHPDRHPAGRAELANRVTAALLTAKRGRS
jgi:hypothetical protein